MALNVNSTKGTILVALVVCLISSIFVSFIAVSLKEKQTINKKLDKKKFILLAANLIENGKKYTKEEIDQKYQQIQKKVIDFQTGDISQQIDIESYDQRKASKDPKMSKALSGEEDIASVLRVAHHGEVYEVLDENSQVVRLILPIKGYGLWSTMYGFIAFGKDKKVSNITYYEHAETPGLGGEIENLKWQALWKGKNVFSEAGELILKVVKSGMVKDENIHVDGMSGATITTVGVDNMIRFWLSDQYYGRYLKNFF